MIRINAGLFLLWFFLKSEIWNVIFWGSQISSQAGAWPPHAAPRSEGPTSPLPIRSASRAIVPCVQAWCAWIQNDAAWTPDQV